MITRKALMLSGFAALLALGGAGAAVAQRAHDGRYMGRGAMMGERFCQAKEPLAPRLIDRITRRVQPTDAQKADFDALSAAITKAETDLKAACPTEAERADMTPPGRLNLAEKRMSAMLAALRTVKEPFTTLYAKLDDKQKESIRWRGRDFGMMGGGKEWGGWRHQGPGGDHGR
jgi:hypothetical protein